MSDISKIINNSIQRVINEDAKEAVDALGALGKNAKEYYDQSIDSLSKGELGGMIADKKEELKAKVLGKIAKAVGGSTADEKFEMAKKLAKFRQEHENMADEKFEMAKKLAKFRQEHENMGVGEHLAKAGKKAGAAIKEKGEEAIQAVKDHPGLAAATAAGLAAAVGGLAAVKRMRKAAKK